MRIQSGKGSALWLACSAALLLGQVGVVHGSTIMVTATVDDTTVNGNCTLREAVIAANTNGAVDACPAGSGADTIILPAGTYVLTTVGAGEDAAATGDLDITADIQIDGAGAATTILDGNAADRVLDVDPGMVGVTAAVSAVTIRNGGAVEQGGGIRNRGDLNIADSIITSNLATGYAAHGGGIRNEGTLTVAASTISSNEAFSPDLGGQPGLCGFMGAPFYCCMAPCAEALGGGIDSSQSTGPLSITGSAIASNTARRGAVNGLAIGGGIVGPWVAALMLADSTVSNNTVISAGGGGFFVPLEFVAGGVRATNGTIVDSTISNNSVPQVGGGVMAFGLDDVTGGLLNIVNSTVSNNSAPLGAGGIGVVGFAPGAIEVLVLANSTISDNGEGVVHVGFDNAVQIVMRNTIVANNATHDCWNRGSNAPLAAPILIANAYNLSSDSNCQGFSGTDQTGVDPLLGPLQNNGGPTFTRALQVGSPARDAGNPATPGSGGNACESEDQRGIGRPQGLQCDIGAVEGSGVGELCGDGIVAALGTCDDGNTMNGDGCSGTCTVEQCYACTGSPSVCTPADGAPCEDGDPCTGGETCSGLVCGGGNDVCGLNHYKCYQGKDLKDPKFVKTTAVLTDQIIAGETVEIQKLKFVCNPVDKNGEGINDPNAHLSCYQIKAPNLAARPTLLVSTQFQETRFEAKKGKLLCMPSTKTIIP